MNHRALRSLIRPFRASAAITTLQVFASTVTALLTYAVAMLALAFWTVPSEEPGYQVIAFGLVALLVVPLITLGTASARLAARSRHDKLATLRLLGATASQVRRLAVAEVAAVATAGVLVGSALSALLPFVLTSFSVYGDRLLASKLWLPLWVCLVIPPVLIMISLVSAQLGLRKVVLSPLGVRTRADAPQMSWLRVLAALLVFGAAILVTQLMSADWGVVVLLGTLTAVLLAVMAVLGAVGPFAVAFVSRRLAARTSDPAKLVAARGIQDDPSAAWRSVSALALATFVLIPTGSLLGYLDTISRSSSRDIMSSDQLLMFADARTMLVTVVALAFCVVACQAAIVQTALILEHRGLYVALDRIGMPRRTINRTRWRRVALSAGIAVIGAAVASVALTAFVVVISILVAPLFSAAIVVVLVLGLVLVRGGVLATSPVMAHVLNAPQRGE